jgi:hypothetical protein
MDLFSKNGRIVKLGSDPSPPGGGAASQVIKLQISIIDAGRPSSRSYSAFSSMTSKYEQNCILWK